MKRDWEQTPGPWALSEGVKGYEREAWEGENGLLPELEIFGWLRFLDTLPGALKPGRHAGTYEIHYLRRGHLRWWVEQENFDFNPGCLFIIRPGELHGGDRDALQPCEHFWLRLGFPREAKSLPELTPKDTQRLRAGFKALEHRTFPASPDVNNFFDRMLQEHRRRDDPNAELMARLMLHALLVVILRDHERYSSIAKQKPMLTWRIRRAHEWLKQRLGTEDFDMQELATLLKMTPSGLRHRFKAETGETMHEFWLRCRMDEARHRLAGTRHDITRIAHDLGFSSSQYFSTVFRKQTGMSPRDYRQLNAAP